MENIAPYNKDKFMPVFKNTEIYKKLKLDYTDNQILWHKFFLLDSAFNKNKGPGDTPREWYSYNFSATVFYYLLPLLEKNPDAIYDLGCGKNMFKKYIPNIIGIGAEKSRRGYTIQHNYNNVKDPSWPQIYNPDDFEKLPKHIIEECIIKFKLNPYEINNIRFFGDLYGYVDDEYIQQHQNYFESVFSICALHFHPISDFKKVVLDFVSMICNNGRGFLAINLQRMIERTDNATLFKLFDTVTPSVLQYEQYIRSELKTTNLKFLILDIDLTLLDEGMDGNIRMVIEK